MNNSSSEQKRMVYEERQRESRVRENFMHLPERGRSQSGGLVYGVSLKSRNSLRHSGFTLIELLVVVAIIGILMALLLPALSMAKASAKKTQCIGNLKQHGLILELYCDDYQEYYPYPPGGRNNSDWVYFDFIIPYANYGAMPDPPWLLNTNTDLPRHMMPYSKFNNIFMCPSGKPYEDYGYILASYYGFNLCFDTSAASVPCIKRPGVSKPSLTWTMADKNPSSGSYRLWMNQVDHRHAAYVVNWLLADGHVEPRKEPYNMTGFISNPRHNTPNVSNN